MGLVNRDTEVEDSSCSGEGSGGLLLLCTSAQDGPGGRPRVAAFLSVRRQRGRLPGEDYCLHLRGRIGGLER